MNNADFAAVVMEPLGCYYDDIRGRLDSFPEHDKKYLSVSSFNHVAWLPVLDLIVSRNPLTQGDLEMRKRYAAEMCGGKAIGSVCLACGANLRPGKAKLPHPPPKNKGPWIELSACKPKPCSTCVEVRSAMGQDAILLNEDGLCHVNKLCPLGSDFGNIGKFTELLQRWRPTVESTIPKKKLCFGTGALSFI